MGKARTNRVPCRHHRGTVRPLYMETMMTDLEIVLLIAFVFMYWMYRRAYRDRCKYKSALVAVGLGRATVHVNEQSKRFKVEMHTND